MDLTDTQYILLMKILRPNPKVFISLAGFMFTLVMLVYRPMLVARSVTIKDVGFWKTKEELLPLQIQGIPNGMCSYDFKSRHLLTSKITGGNGNQLFALSTLIAAADDACFTPLLNVTLGMDRFFDIKNILRLKIQPLNGKALFGGGWGIYSGPIAHKIDTDHNWTIHGSRESYKYFIHKKELVRSSFVFKEDIKTVVKTFFDEHSLINRTKVGMHVRRGDFLKPRLVEYGFSVSSLSYIERAMAYFKYHLSSSDLVFIIVSDDISWCKDNIHNINTYFSPFHDAGKDLYLLTQCDHNIVTVGSFGWMGAWLNETGTVIYDKSYPRYKSRLWYQHRKEDVFPDWWIGL